MHARELVELAGMVAEHSAALTEGDRPIPAECLEQYWTFSKIRLDRSARTFKEEVFGPQVRGTVEEILAGEILARVWNAVLAIYDRRRGGDEAEPIARSVMLGHAEARNRALSLLLHVPQIDAQAAIELNRLRRHAERCTDLLLEKIEAPETHWERHPADRSAAKFQTPFSASSPNPDLNARIAASVMACFPEEVLDEAGLSVSLWYVRVMNAADEAQSMIDGLLAD